MAAQDKERLKGKRQALKEAEKQRKQGHKIFTEKQQTLNEINKLENKIQQRELNLEYWLNRGRPRFKLEMVSQLREL